MTISVGITIERSPQQVWDCLESIEDHVNWMADAEAIRFQTPHHSGLGTVFECDTKVGPIRLVDVMEITSWEPPHQMGVHHKGLVQGDGMFTIEASGAGASWFSWTETLTFPWWMGGALGAAVSRPILRSIWRSNLKRLRVVVEEQTEPVSSDTPN